MRSTIIIEQRGAGYISTGPGSGICPERSRPLEHERIEQCQFHSFAALLTKMPPLSSQQQCGLQNATVSKFMTTRPR